jgi:hypothetical protein
MSDRRFGPGGRQAWRLRLAACAAVAFTHHIALAGSFTATKTVDATIDTAAWVANSGAAYGRAMNGNSFETETIGAFNGFQYTAYWKNVSGTGRLAVARRAIGSSTWSSATLSSAFVNGPNDAHCVPAFGIDPKDGTIHLAYDMHGHNLRYRVSAAGLTTNPGSFTWSTANVATLFPTAERSNLPPAGRRSPRSRIPMFVRTPVMISVLLSTTAAADRVPGFSTITTEQHTPGTRASVR